jgi:type II secretory pathway pseudopilin PulG
MARPKVGFTLIELLIGMIITTMVLTALSVVAFAVSTSWQQAEAANGASVTGTQVQTRITQWFRPSCNLGALQAGSLTSTLSPASLFFWMGDLTDATYPTGDGKIEFNEIGLLRYDSASQELRLYQATDWSTWSTSAKNTANGIAGTTYMNTVANMADFMTACPNYQVVMRNVTGMVLHKQTPFDRPLVEFVIKLEDSKGNSSTHYGTVTLRTVTTASN